MDIGRKIRTLRTQLGLTQQDLAERTNLTKGYISQLENDLNSPSIETLFQLLEVLGTSPKEFFDDKSFLPRVKFSKEDQIHYEDAELGYEIIWLVPDMKEKMMEPILVRLKPNGQSKQFEPSLSETFGYCLKGKLLLKHGTSQTTIEAGDSFYYEATETHQILNASNEPTEIIFIATESYF